MLVINLAACNHLVPLPGDGWQLRGRVAIRTAEDATSLSIHWSQVQDQFDIRFTTTLGIPVAHIYGDEHGATLESEAGIYSADSAQALLQQQTGLILSMQDLRYWVQGDPAPGSSFQWFENTLSQSDWLIEYKSYGQGRPTKLKMMRADVTIILAIKQWL